MATDEIPAVIINRTPRGDIRLWVSHEDMPCEVKSMLAWRHWSYGGLPGYSARAMEAGLTAGDVRLAHLCADNVWIRFSESKRAIGIAP